MKTAFVVLGMHRSGTSSVAGALARLGPKPPLTLLEPSEDNPRGFWESPHVVEVNDQLLQAGGSYWRDWQSFRSDGIAADFEAAIQAKISNLLSVEFGDAPEIVLKDPRLCRLFRYWERPLEAAGYRAVFLLPLRFPFEVAASLIHRNGMSKAECLLLWLRHVIEAEKITRGRPRVLFLWDDFIENWRAVLGDLSEVSQWRCPAVDGPRGDEVDAFLSGDLKRQRHSGADLDADPESHVWISQAWGALSSLARGREVDQAHARLDAVREAMDVASDIYGRAFGPVLWEAHQANLQRDDIARKVAGLEQQAAVLADQNERFRGVIFERDVRVGELNRYGAVQAHRARQAEAEAEALIQQIEDSRERLAEAEKCLANQRERLASCEDRRADLEAQLQASLRETASLRTDLAAAVESYATLLADLLRRPLATWWRHRRGQGKSS